MSENKTITLVSKEDFLELLDCVNFLAREVKFMGKVSCFGNTFRYSMSEIEQRLFDLKEKYTKDK